MNIYKYTISYTTNDRSIVGSDRKILSADYITLADHIEEARERCWFQFNRSHEYERPQVYSVSGQLIAGEFIARPL